MIIATEKYEKFLIVRNLGGILAACCDRIGMHVVPLRNMYAACNVTLLALGVKQNSAINDPCLKCSGLFA